MVGTLFLSDEGRNDFVKMMDFFLWKRDTGAGIRKDSFLFLPGIISRVKTLFEAAGTAVYAAVADIRRFCKPVTYFRPKVTAESIAHATASAEWIFPFRMTGVTDVAFETLQAQSTGIIIQPCATNTSENEMWAYFYGNGGRGFIEGIRYLPEHSI